MLDARAHDRESVRVRGWSSRRTKLGFDIGGIHQDLTSGLSGSRL